MNSLCLSVNAETKKGRKERNEKHMLHLTCRWILATWRSLWCLRPKGRLQYSQRYCFLFCSSSWRRCLRGGDCGVVESQVLFHVQSYQTARKTNKETNLSGCPILWINKTKPTIKCKEKLMKNKDLQRWRMHDVVKDRNVLHRFYDDDLDSRRKRYGVRVLVMLHPSCRGISLGVAWTSGKHFRSILGPWNVTELLYCSTGQSRTDSL